ncbi:hypothetical protein GCM10027275_24260 [Rhabdobacter roseus]|uniref:Outer membrane protein TolC n=1 Tax=Rhabdobacter roseus TaxID=1655419 RepID=A0A840TJJ1_9BACT|nr:TolC family protein [Rhabdobacter roseus]MBB5284366.1 outer membrane protein TolC [Rhabdobacter roseus]
MIKATKLLLVVLSLSAQAQDSPILNAYVEEGLRNNLSLRQESGEVAKVAETLRQAKALFYPRVTFAPTYSLAAGGRRLQFPVGDLLNPVYRTLNELTQGGGTFPQVENVNELLAPTNFHDTKLSIQYTLYNPEIQYNYLITNSLLSAQEARQRVVENEVRYAIEVGYYQYLQSLEAARITERSQGTLAELVRLNRKLVQNNAQTLDAVYAAEYEQSTLEQQRAEAAKNSVVARAYFNFLLNRDLNQEIRVDSTLLQRAEPELLPTEHWSGLAVSNRSELRQLQLSVVASEQTIRLHELAAKRPTVFVGGNAGFQGFGYTFKGQEYGIAQVGMSWDLFKGYERKSKIQQARIQTDLLKTKYEELENQIRLQVIQAEQDLLASRQSWQAATQGLTKAEQYFKIVDSRYRNGNALLIEYLKAQNDVQTARLRQSLTRYEVLIKTATLHKTSALP